MICILTRTSTPALEARAKAWGATLIADDESIVTDAELIAAGWTHMNDFIAGKAITSWERATYWAYSNKYRHTWFIEDDVVASADQHIHALLDSYKHSKADLIAMPIAWERADKPDWPHWNTGRKFFYSNELAASFNVVCRMSYDLLGTIASYTGPRRRLVFLEVLFASAVKKRGLQFSPLVSERLLLRYRPVFTQEQIDYHTKTSYARIFHPVKA